MGSRWNDGEAPTGGDDLDLLVHASRLLGADPSLVLAGGGSSSVKATLVDAFGDPVDVLWVKGGGADMATIGRAGFAPLRLDRVARLAELAELADSRMANELRVASLDAGAPPPSVESILHAILPDRFVLHSQADAVLALTGTPAAEAPARELYGRDAVVVPYVRPGFALARACAEHLAAGRHGGTAGMVLCKHGLFTFAADARTAYERHIDLVARARARVEGAPALPGGTAAGDPSARSTPAGVGEPAGDARPGDELDAGAFGAGDASAFGSGAAVPGGEPAPAGTGGPAGTAVPPGDLGALAALRRDISAAVGGPMILSSAAGAAARRFAAREDVGIVSQAGPATPDHALRTRRVPLVGRDVAGYGRDHQAYVARHRARLGDRPVVPVDPAPRVVIDPELGVVGAGRVAADATAAREIYEHTVWIIERAEALGGYAGVAEADAFDVEYGELEQAEPARRPAPAPLAGQVALVTGAASGIGRASARALLAAGAAVVGLDLDAGVSAVAGGPAYEGIQADAGDPEAVGAALARAVRAFGGLDVLVLDAGMLPPAEPVAEVAPASWERALGVDAGAALTALRAAHPFLRLSPAGGSVVVVGSGNVPAPGRGTAAYSASKAALTQIARVTALEWGSDGIRVNVVHPDAVSDTGTGNDARVAERAAGPGPAPEAYRTRNVLGAEVTADHVADAVVALCGPAFARTTGAQITVDGGNDRVI